MKNRTEDSEAAWDRLLGIKTSGRDDSHSDQHCYPYEPTPYAVLERLCGSGLITKKNILLDAGCGKGRVDFSCPGRPDAGAMAWSMMSGSSKAR